MPATFAQLVRSLDRNRLTEIAETSADVTFTVCRVGATCHQPHCRQRPAHVRRGRPETVPVTFRELADSPPCDQCATTVHRGWNGRTWGVLLMLNELEQAITSAVRYLAVAEANRTRPPHATHKRLAKERDQLRNTLRYSRPARESLLALRCEAAINAAADLLTRLDAATGSDQDRAATLELVRTTLTHRSHPGRTYDQTPVLFGAVRQDYLTRRHQEMFRNLRIAGSDQGPLVAWMPRWAADALLYDMGGTGRGGVHEVVSAAGTSRDTAAAAAAVWVEHATRLNDPRCDLATCLADQLADELTGELTGELADELVRGPGPSGD